MDSKSLMMMLLAGAAAFSAVPRPALERLPLTFERNSGQLRSKAAWIARGANTTLQFLPGEVVMTGRAGAPVRMRMPGANAAARWSGELPQPQVSNYLNGRDETQWRKSVGQFGRLRYSGVYLGVDLLFYGSRGLFEYDFLVSPGADPAAIELEFDGVSSLRVASDGALEVAAGGGVLVHHRPVAYQKAGGRREPVAARFEQTAPRRVRFVLGGYDTSKPLVIDPVLQYSSYFGGKLPTHNAEDEAYAVAVDAEGSIYIAGRSTASDLPAENGYQRRSKTSGDAFVTKLDPAGKRVIWTTYLGGASLEYAYAIAVDAQGQVHVTGVTGSADYPVKNAYQSRKTGLNIIFVTKLAASGDGIVFSSYLGGERNDTGYGIGVDQWGNVFVAGRTNSAQFPVKNAYQAKFGGSYDGVIARFSPEGELQFSTYFGGTGNDELYGMAVDEDGFIYVTGATNTPELARGNAPFTKPLGRDAFAGKMTPSGDAWEWFTYFGGKGADEGHAIAVDGYRRVYVAGYTTSADLPGTANAFQMERAGTSDAFVAKLNAAGTEVEWATYLGGTSPAPTPEDEGATAVAVDPDGCVYVSGTTVSQDFPTARAVQPEIAGKRDAFITKISATGSELIYSTFAGGAENDRGLAIAIDGLRAAYIAGHTYSADLPAVAEFSSSRGGNSDAFVQRICDPVIFLSGHFLELSYTQGGEVPKVENFGARACMDLALAVDVTDSPAWLAAEAGPAGSGSMPVAITLKPEDLEPGSYSAQLLISSPESWFEPKVVTVTLHVAPPPPAGEQPFTQK